MTMYTHLLSNVSDDGVDSLTGAALVDFTLARRTEMLASHGSAVHHHGESAYSALAVEITYDRALLKLCAANDIEASVQGFSHPSERIRLEQELARMGVDLTAPVRHGETT